MIVIFPPVRDKAKKLKNKQVPKIDTWKQEVVQGFKVTGLPMEQTDADLIVKVMGLIGR